MMRPALRWPSRAVATNSAPSQCIHQRRNRMFERKTTEDNKTYYVKRRSQPPDEDFVPPQQEFFDMPDLLLDLDAEGVDHVRSFRPADERAMAKMWSASPRRNEVKAQMRDLEREVIKAKQRTAAILEDPAHPWRLTPNDLFTAAVRAPIVAASETQERHINTVEESFSALWKRNGIPAHAALDDERLLEWLLLRHRGLTQHIQRGRDSPFKFDTFSSSISRAISLEEVRRTASAYLRAAQSKPDKQFAQAVRRACHRILVKKPQYADDALRFISNITAKFQAKDAQQAVLAPLALRLACQTGNLDIAREWLRITTELGSSQQPEDLIEDLFFGLQGLGRSVVDGGMARYDLALQLLTGYNGTAKPVPQSIRSLLQAITQGRQPEYLALLDVYLTLLGQLGAGNTLQSEWAELNQRDSKTAQLLQKTFYDAETLAKSINKSIQASTVSKDLAEAVRLDLEGVQSTGSSQGADRAAGDSLAVFSLPLNEYIEWREALAR